MARRGVARRGVAWRGVAWRDPGSLKLPNFFREGHQLPGMEDLFVRARIRNSGEQSYQSTVWSTGRGSSNSASLSSAFPTAGDHRWTEHSELWRSTRGDSGLARELNPTVPQDQVGNTYHISPRSRQKNSSWTVEKKSAKLRLKMFQCLCRNFKCGCKFTTRKS